MYLKDNRVDTIVDLIKKYGGGTPQGGAPFQQLVTDADGKAVWEERLAYDEVGTIIEKKTYHSIGHANDVAIYIDTESLGMATYIAANLMTGLVELVVDGVSYPLVLDMATGKFMDGDTELRIPIAKDDESSPDGKHTELFKLRWVPDNTGDNLPYFMLFIQPYVSGDFYAEIEVRIRQFKQIAAKYLPIVSSKASTLFDGEVELEEAYGLYGARIECDGMLNLHATYLVTWDGAEYECVPFAMESAPCFGNIGVLTGQEGSGEPFLFAPGEDALIVYATSAGAHDVTIVETNTELKEAYLPTLTSPNGTKYRLTVADDGTLGTVQA